MTASRNYLAIDLGASSGRAMLGAFDGELLKIREIHRFANLTKTMDSGLHWDIAHLIEQVRRSIAIAVHRLRARHKLLNAIGIDSWGVDYGLRSSVSNVMVNPHHYRDPRTQGLIEDTARIIPKAHIYARTGVQFQPFNTLYQLLADQRSDPRALESKTLLFIPDLLNFFITGMIRTEETIASTSQFFDTQERAWAKDLLQSLNLPTDILPDVATPGTTLGPLHPDLSKELGTQDISVISPASHDTASAVVAVPASGEDRDWAYISSGTWLLAGRELSAPIRTPEAMAANFTNECGLGATIRFQKNITGLWLLQECQRIWAKEHRRYSFDQLRGMALEAPSLQSLVDPDEPSFSQICDMPTCIRAFCARTGQELPDSDGAIIRCILESLALKCRVVIDLLESLTGPVRVVHVVGGGANNALLCQFMANATGRPVLAGPVEATAVGNIMAQVLAEGGVDSLTHIRRVVAASFEPIRYEPADREEWEAALARFLRFLPN